VGSRQLGVAEFSEQFFAPPAEGLSLLPGHRPMLLLRRDKTLTGIAQTYQVQQMPRLRTLCVVQGHGPPEVMKVQAIAQKGEEELTEM